MRWLLPLSAVLALCMTQNATANSRFDPWAFGVKAAERTWGGQPPCGTPVFVRVPDSEIDAVAADVKGSVGQVEFGDTQVAGAAYADPVNCRIVYGSLALRAAAPDLCALIVHEYGHLFGLAHSDDPNSPMYDGALDVDQAPACAWCITTKYIERHRWVIRRGKRVFLWWSIEPWVLRPGC